VTRVVVEADGGSRGNPGPAGYGAVVRDASTGAVLAEVGDAIGTATNNVAEYRGLIAGLEAAIALGADEVDVRMDSLLVVNQMSNKWQVKHAAMRPLASEAADLVRRFGRVSFTHIPRELNKHADRLANEAMDRAAGRAPKRRVAPSGWSAPGGPSTSLLLLRHGQTALSVERRFSGHGDPDLTELGREQARAAAQRLASSGAVRVVSSPLRRARDTAAAVADVLGVGVDVDVDLVETDFGEWEGLTFTDIRERWPDEVAAWRSDPAVAPPGGESFTAVAARVRRARERLVASAPGQTVVVVSHVTPIKTLLQQALDVGSHVLYRIHLDVASLSATDWWPDGNALVRLVNDTTHLVELTPQPNSR
jgi:probable phosphoglycerate mutase